MLKVSFGIKISKNSKRHKLDKHLSKETKFTFPDWKSVQTKEKYGMAPAVSQEIILL